MKMAEDNNPSCQVRGHGAPVPLACHRAHADVTRALFVHAF
jgi:hypothetical protein